jgi:hypothetical protein
MAKRFLLVMLLIVLFVASFPVNAQATCLQVVEYWNQATRIPLDWEQGWHMIDSGIEFDVTQVRLEIEFVGFGVVETPHGDDWASRYAFELNIGCIL